MIVYYIGIYLCNEMFCNCYTQWLHKSYLVYTFLLYNYCILYIADIIWFPFLSISIFLRFYIFCNILKPFLSNYLLLKSTHVSHSIFLLVLSIIVVKLDHFFMYYLINIGYDKLSNIWLNTIIFSIKNCSLYIQHKIEIKFSTP